METQKDVNEKMRAILVDWLIEVHHKFKLVPETMYTTVNLIDRYLETQVRGGEGGRRPAFGFSTASSRPGALTRVPRVPDDPTDQPAARRRDGDVPRVQVRGDLRAGVP